MGDWMFWVTIANSALVIVVAVLHKMHRDAVANALESLRKDLPGGGS